MDCFIIEVVVSGCVSGGCDPDGFGFAVESVGVIADCNGVLVSRRHGDVAGNVEERIGCNVDRVFFRQNFDFFAVFGRQDDVAHGDAGGVECALIGFGVSDSNLVGHSEHLDIRECAACDRFIVIFVYSVTVRIVCRRTGDGERILFADHRDRCRGDLALDIQRVRLGEEAVAGRGARFTVFPDVNVGLGTVVVFHNVISIDIVVFACGCLRGIRSDVCRAHRDRFRNQKSVGGNRNGICRILSGIAVFVCIGHCDCTDFQRSLIDVERVGSLRSGHGDAVRLCGRVDLDGLFALDVVEFRTGDNVHRVVAFGGHIDCAEADDTEVCCAADIQGIVRTRHIDSVNRIARVGRNISFFIGLFELAVDGHGVLAIRRHRYFAAVRAGKRERIVACFGGHSDRIFDRTVFELRGIVYLRGHFERRKSDNGCGIIAITLNGVGTVLRGHLDCAADGGEFRVQRIAVCCGHADCAADCGKLLYSFVLVFALFRIPDLVDVRRTGDCQRVVRNRGILFLLSRHGNVFFESGVDEGGGVGAVGACHGDRSVDLRLNSRGSVVVDFFRSCRNFAVLGGFARDTQRVACCGGHGDIAADDSIVLCRQAVFRFRNHGDGAGGCGFFRSAVDCNCVSNFGIQLDFADRGGIFGGVTIGIRVAGGVDVQGVGAVGEFFPASHCDRSGNRIGLDIVLTKDAFADRDHIAVFAVSGRDVSGGAVDLEVIVRGGRRGVDAGDFTVNRHIVFLVFEEQIAIVDAVAVFIIQIGEDHVLFDGDIFADGDRVVASLNGEVVSDSAFALEFDDICIREQFNACDIGGTFHIKCQVVFFGCGVAVIITHGDGTRNGRVFADGQSVGGVFAAHDDVARYGDFGAFHIQFAVLGIVAVILV